MKGLLSLCEEFGVSEGVGVSWAKSAKSLGEGRDTIGLKV